MRFFAATVTSAILCYLVGFILPWWSIAICTFLVSLVFHQRPRVSFLSGFLAVFLLWTFYALWIDTQNHSILSKRVAGILPLAGNPLLLILTTGVIGGIVGGMAASIRPRPESTQV